MTYDDDEDEQDAESVAGSATGISTQTQAGHASKQDKQKIEALKKLEKQLNDDIKNNDEGGGLRNFEFILYKHKHTKKS